MEAYLTYGNLCWEYYEQEFNFNKCVKIELELLPKLGDYIELSTATKEKMKLAFLTTYESWNEYKSKGAITARCNEHNYAVCHMGPTSEYYNEPYMFRNKKTNKVDCRIMDRRNVVDDIRYFEHDCKIYPVIKLVDSWKYD